MFQNVSDPAPDFHTFRSSFPFLDIPDPAMEPINHFSEMNHSTFQGFLPFSSDNFLAHQTVPDFAGSLPETFPGTFMQNSNCQNPNVDAPPASHPAILAVTNYNDPGERKMMKKVDIVSESSSMSSSPQVSECGIKRKHLQNSRKGKRVKSTEEEEEEKQKEVVHVRARRGQATDSHSLAERVRRGKINERLKCLQDIVPGCYKTMGMAVMLDEIINYVQSLQNQVEFLSMKLTAASAFYDFSAESDGIETVQRAKAKEMEKVGYGGGGTWSLN